MPLYLRNFRNRPASWCSPNAPVSNSLHGLDATADASVRSKPVSYEAPPVAGDVFSGILARIACRSFSSVKPRRQQKTSDARSMAETVRRRGPQQREYSLALLTHKPFTPVAEVRAQPMFNTSRDFYLQETRVTGNTTRLRKSVRVPCKGSSFRFLKSAGT